MLEIYTQIGGRTHLYIKKNNKYYYMIDNYNVLNLSGGAIFEIAPLEKILSFVERTPYYCKALVKYYLEDI